MIRSGLTIILLCLGLAIFAQQDPVLMRINGKEILRSGSNISIIRIMPLLVSDRKH